MVTKRLKRLTLATVPQPRPPKVRPTLPLVAPAIHADAPHHRQFCQAMEVIMKLIADGHRTTMLGNDQHYGIDPDFDRKRGASATLTSRALADPSVPHSRPTVGPRRGAAAAV